MVNEQSLECLSDESLSNLSSNKVPRTWCKTFGDLAFAVAVPRF